MAKRDSSQRSKRDGKSKRSKPPPKAEPRGEPTEDEKQNAAPTESEDGQVFIGGALKTLKELIHLGDTGKEIAAKIGIPEARYSRLLSKSLPASIRDLVLIARAYEVSISYLLGDEPKLVEQVMNGLVSYRAGSVYSEDQVIHRDVTLHALRGTSFDGIVDFLSDVRARQRGSESTEDADLEQAEHDIEWIVRGSLGLRLVELVMPEDPLGWCDAELADELSLALTELSPYDRKIDVVVVPSLVGEGFNRDPAAPFVVARLGHFVVRRFFKEHLHATHLGLGGGFHVGAFVHTAGIESSPMPPAHATDRPYTLLPLTLEPFHDHSRNLADSLVGHMAHTVTSMLGPNRVFAPSTTSFGFLVDREVGPLKGTSIEVVRQHYNMLDVAVYGCGSVDGDSWLNELRKFLGPLDEGRAHTDMCLNMLDRDGNLVPFPSQRGGRLELLGADLGLIQGLARRRDKLALLLCSGRGKGEGMKILASAGCLNAVVCDEAAARACLDAIG